MPTFIIFISISLSCVTLCSLYMFVRNIEVYDFLTTLINQVKAKSLEDVHNRKDYNWRFEKFREVSYQKVLFQFWKPLQPKYYWDDLTFLK